MYENSQPNNNENKNLTLPVIALYDIVAFPSITINFELTDDASKAALGAATDSDGRVVIIPYTDTDAEIIRTNTDAYKILSAPCVGTKAKIKQTLITPDGNIRVIAEGICRYAVTSLDKPDKYIIAGGLEFPYTALSLDDVTAEAYREEIKLSVRHISAYATALSDDVQKNVRIIKTPELLTDFVASNILLDFDAKTAVLSELDPVARIELLLRLLAEEEEVLACEYTIRKKVAANINKQQKAAYLREQLRVIKSELGYEGADAAGEDGGNVDDDDDSLYLKIMSTTLPEEVKAKLLRENSRMTKVPYGSSEYSVLRTYIETCLEIPWNKKTKDRVDIAAARKILDADHDGIENVKERILEYLAVKQLNPELKHQIICLVGPPGVGKTSVAISLASAMRRKYVRVSLGGVRDEADIRGHRKTYVASMPGRIINAVIASKVNNPLILLDEIDKLTHDAHGDPSSALLEVLDSEQNKTFRDHYIELPFDLSDCVFIATANTLETVPRPLIDRMEVIELKTYTPAEKLSIAKNHLIPKQYKRHGLTKRALKLPDATVSDVIEYYTREAGVRNLERTIAELCRKAAMKLVTDGVTRIVIEPSNLHEYLGARKYLPTNLSEENEVGVVNGLAFTEVGGELLKIEVAVLDGSGKIELTGSLGDVMKESAMAAFSYVRSIADKYKIPHDFYKTKDIHIHVPEGAVPKDGPSAGITIMTALVSALTNIPVKRDIAMTGEITLRGNVLAIGGLKEKTMAAYLSGIKQVIIPAQNLPNLDDIDKTVRDAVDFIPVKYAEEVLSAALVPATDEKTAVAVAEQKSMSEITDVSISLPVTPASRPSPRI